MSLKQYRNELLLAAALLLALISFVYKTGQHTEMALENQRMAQEAVLLQEIVSLKKIWADKRIAKKLESVRSLVPSSKVKWEKKGRKLTVTFKDLQPAEVNKIVTKLLNIPVQIEKMKVAKEGENYKMEIRCKW